MVVDIVMEIEQVVECPDWLNKGVCLNFRQCPHFHHSVECDFWIEYGKCNGKNSGECKLYHRKIWIPVSINSNDNSNSTSTTSDNNT